MMFYSVKLIEWKVYCFLCKVVCIKNEISRDI